MKYTVLRIAEDVDYGCEERDVNQPVMAVVTLRDEEGMEITVLGTIDNFTFATANKANTVNMSNCFAE